MLAMVLEIAIEEKANPTRPPVGSLILIQPPAHALPFCVRRRTDVVLAIYDCPEQRIDAHTAPLLWANMSPSEPCRASCSGQCTGDLSLEIWVSDRFPLLPLDVYMLFVDELHLDPHTCGELPDVWIPICTRPSSLPRTGEENAAEAHAEDAADLDQQTPGTPPERYLSASGCRDWLKAAMRTLADLSDADRFYDGFMEKYKEENGYFPKDSARTFARMVDRCRREIQNESDGAQSQ